MNCFESYTNSEDVTQPILVTAHDIFTKRITAVHWCQISENEGEELP